MGFLDLVEKRYSCRSYDGRPLSEGDRKEMESLFCEYAGNPFGTTVRLALLDNDRLTGKKLGTYGIIRGAAQFIAGVAENGAMDREALGYSMERAVLAATQMNLGTCWLAGTYNRVDFQHALLLSGEERIVCVSPVGYPADKPTALDRMMRSAAGSARRKAWEALFFDAEFGKPLSGEAAGEYRDALEAVRLAPSSSNGQPWRIVRQGGKFHFYRAGGDHCRVDMGIAACHFEFAARDTGLAGEWRREETDRQAESRHAYSFTWITG